MLSGAVMAKAVVGECGRMIKAEATECVRAVEDMDEVGGAGINPNIS